MKPLPPTLRPDKRYVLSKIVPAGFEPEGKDLYYAVYDAAVSLYGDCGAAEMSMSVVYSASGYVIMRCSRGFEEKLETAARMVFRISGTDCALHCKASSGTIAALKRKIPPSASYEITADIKIGDNSYSVCPVSQEKVDLYKEGIKHQDTLYFTREDLEEQ
ncbi:MAG: Rpp14/Pop5 family protein [Methanomicrobium sp.]|nr:Rpp14/Pop5 family protein [Methanomicrobium sp.]MDD4299885.1 Rpp14/Pop5 family protein [Methanomicrobium sp.]